MGMITRTVLASPGDAQISFIADFCLVYNPKLRCLWVKCVNSHELVMKYLKRLGNDLLNDFYNFIAIFFMIVELYAVSHTLISMAGFANFTQLCYFENQPFFW